jgi:hypothetical protein
MIYNWGITNKIKTKKMKQIKILVGSISDKKRRKELENEINSYMELAWKIVGTHQSSDLIDGKKTLVLTVIIENPLEE